MYVIEMLGYRRPSSRLALWIVAFTASCAAFVPAPAWADDGDAAPSASAAEPAAATDPTTSLVHQAADEAEAVVEAVIATTTDDEDAAVVTTEDDEAAGQPPDSTEQATEMDADVASTDGSEPDTTADSPDTTTDSTASATVGEGASRTAPSAPSTTPVAGTTNINVIVRIGSAGDNGPVSQTATSVAPSSKPSSAALTSTAAARPGAAGSLTAASGEEAGSPWYWEWNCRDLPLVPVVSPTDSGGESFPRTWTWIWNCGKNSDEYHDETTDQYRPSNTNVSIRLSSPGDNGPVTQTTIAISARAASVSLPTIEFPTVTLTTPAITVTAPAVGITIPSIVVEAPTEALTAQLAPEAAAEWPVDIALGSVSASAPSTSLTAIAPTPRGGIPFGADRRHQAALHAAYGRLGTVTASPGAADRGASTGTRHDPRKAKAVPRRTPSRSAPDQKLPMSPVSSTSVSAAGTGGSPGGGLPIFLALPFIAAMLDLARRVALERATWPSGHRRRVPDTPG